MTAAGRTWFVDKRHAEVLCLLANERRVESARLAGRFSVSAESIRKDLAQLGARGLLRRVHADLTVEVAGRRA
jgi:DeoR family fructose operon transcriptional repressor